MMTRDEILKLEAGRELDALIAENVMGVTAYEHDFEADGECSKCRCQIDFHSGRIYLRSKKMDDRSCVNPDPYSSDIRKAWEVVEKFDNQCMLNNVHGVWECYFPDNAKGEAETAPLAICRAALLAVMKDE